jgi:hypothetical protein
MVFLAGDLADAVDARKVGGFRVSVALRSWLWTLGYEVLSLRQPNL